MKFFVCKKCGYMDATSSVSWEVKREDEDAILLCPKCNNKKFLKMTLSIESIGVQNEQV